VTDKTQAPKHRGDIAGCVALHTQDCEDAMRNQIAHADEFILIPEDCPAWDEYKDTLTERELRACFRRAQRSDSGESRAAGWPA
jgi:hypothetical protein